MYPRPVVVGMVEVVGMVVGSVVVIAVGMVVGRVGMGIGGTSDMF